MGRIKDEHYWTSHAHGINQITVKRVMDVDRIFDNMIRCTKCILPETFPDIELDENGVCNYCLNYKPTKVYGEEELEKVLDKYRDKGAKYDCLVPVSGGRDSAFVLYKIVKEYDMRTVAITIESWSTKEAIRNLKKMTQILNVKHVFLKDEKSLNKARQNRKQRFHAWLKKPSISLIIPIMTPADKTMNWQLYRYAKENEIPLVLGGNNVGNSSFEFEHFKTGFLGVFPDDRGIFTTTDRIKLAFLFGYEYMGNFRYLRWSSLEELVKGFLVYYFFGDLFRPKGVEMLGFYDYVYWNEREILSTITKELDWKGAPDTTATWRTDDRYSSLYNYLYYSLVGFTEHDEMYSKMIREGQISREEALKRCIADHIPRMPSLVDIFVELDVTKKQVDQVLEQYRAKLLSKTLRRKL